MHFWKLTAIFSTSGEGVDISTAYICYPNLRNESSFTAVKIYASPILDLLSNAQDRAIPDGRLTDF
jgi:hypothetical protein